MDSNGVLDWSQAGTKAVMETVAGPLQSGVSGGLPREASPCIPQSFEGRCLQVIIYPSSRVLLHGYLSVFSALEGTQVSKGVERQETPWDSCLGSLASTNLLSPFFPQSQPIAVPRPAGPAPNPPPIGE